MVGSWLHGVLRWDGGAEREGTSSPRCQTETRAVHPCKDPLHGQADLFGNHVARRLRRRRGGQLRLGDAGRSGACIRQRPRTADRHLPVRPSDVRGDARLGDHAHAARSDARGARLRGDLAGGRQDRVLDHPPGGDDGADAPRAGARSGPGAEDEGDRIARRQRGRSPSRGAGDPGGTGRRIPPLRQSRRGGRRHRGAAAPPPGRSRTARERRFANGVVHLHYRTRP